VAPESRRALGPLRGERVREEIAAEDQDEQRADGRDRGTAREQPPRDPAHANRARDEDRQREARRVGSDEHGGGEERTGPHGRVPGPRGERGGTKNNWRRVSMPIMLSSHGDVTISSAAEGSAGVIARARATGLPGRRTRRPVPSLWY
jgi:hypothetical protein